MLGSGDTAGGFVGSAADSAVTTSSSFNMGMSGFLSSTGGLSRTMRHLKEDQDNYTGWNFSSTWTMDSADDYPDLGATPPDRKPVNGNQPAGK